MPVSQKFYGALFYAAFLSIVSSGVYMNQVKMTKIKCS
jgi:hypothetical protein